ncbi:DNA polymerase I [Thalassoglobus sp. JC818]|uniref:DNA polymerase I n=1 Tax=Thalassoglobus sp. JC818 TaxID=3232136 RepID=UPI00345AD98C
MAETLYIIDTFSLVFQVFHAIRQPMTGTRGQPTNAVYGFTGDIQHLLKEKSPTHIICAMESATPQERVAIYTEYKANRDEMPDDLRPQIPMILDVVEGYGIPIVSYPGWEADDVIATVATRAAAEGMDVCVVTSDKDIRQLLSPKIKIYSIRKRSFFDEENLWDEWGVRPDQVIDFQSLVGDSVDNVPGVPLVGPKKAQMLLEKFETLDAVLENADQAPGKKLASNLKEFADQARMSKELVALKTDLPIELSWDDCRVQAPDHERLLELFRDFGFRRYANEMETEIQKGAGPDPEVESRSWRTISTSKEFNDFLKDLQKEDEFCVDLETTSVDPLQADIVGWAFCWKAHQSFYLPVDGPPGSATLNADEVLAALKPILEDPTKTIVNQNIKYDYLVLRRVGVEIATIGLDSMIGDYLLDAGARTHKLDEISKKYLHREMIPISDLIGKGKKQLKMFEVDVDAAAEYASEDADVCWQLTEIIGEQLKEENLWGLYWDLERPLIKVLAEMEWNGVRVDVEELKRQSDHLTLRLSQLVEEIHSIAGSNFNIDSPKQLSKVLFEDLKLPVIKKTKTGLSTDQEVLEKLAHEHPLPAKLIEHRQLSKLKGTYLDALPALVNKTTGHIHTSFSQTTAATGRLSSSDPNLQNIPIRTDEGQMIRKAFVPSQPGWKLVCLDYSQIELRMLAHFCKDEELQRAFRDGEDIHRTVAAQVYGVPVEDVDSSQRRVAKAVNFGVIYGQSAYGLAAALSIPKEEAAQFIDDYFTKYASVQEFMDRVLDECKESGYARTILGRRREISGIRPKRWGNLNLPERTAVNTVIQGSAADLIKQAMINVFNQLKKQKHSARMLLQIHDELVFEAPAEDVDSLISLARHEMETALDLDVPLVIDCKQGDNWLDAD